MTESTGLREGKTGLKLNLARLRRYCRKISVFVACAATASVTPIIIGRIPDGFLIGTNFSRSDGVQTCKVQYAGRRLLLVAGQPVTGEYRTPGGRTTMLFDIDRDLWQIRLDKLTVKQILDSARQIIAQRLSEYQEAILSVPSLDPGFDLVLVSIEGPEPQLWLENIKFSKADRKISATVDNFDMPPGKVFEIVNRSGPLSPTVPKVTKEAILGELQKATLRHIQSGDVSYAPPYMVIELTSGGLKFLTDDRDLCTGSHPIH